ncbi:MAG: RsmB/NOP family class I SAM-dependent RNA methyltransferase, partial [Xanthomonadales bacterium]|nr:RsmB/NOP family class I SAM-dependent RNA methyltransferase [Xanthomonadales bacterium]
MRGSLMLDGADLGALFSGGPHAPAPLSADECTPPRSLYEAPRAVRLDLPDWLARDLEGLPDTALEPLRRRAILYLRVNTLKATGDDAQAALAAEGIETEPGPLAEDCLAVTCTPHRVQGSRAYLDGLVEIQDAASQAVTAFAAARPGESVLDFCAGAGG